MNLFKHLESGRAYPPRRILLYGIHGIGTSSFATGLPSAVFVPADQSIAHLNCQRFPVAKNFADLMQSLQELYIEPHDYDTVVLDPLGAIELLIRDEVCREHNIKHSADLPQAGDYVLGYWRRLLRRLDLLRSDIDLHVVLVGHAQEPSTRRYPSHNSERPQPHQPAQRYRPALSGRICALLQSWCDEVLFATHAVSRPAPLAGAVPPAAPSLASQGADGLPEDPRVLHTIPSPSYVAKNHLNLPPQLPLRPEALVPYLHPASTSSQVPPANLN